MAWLSGRRRGRDTTERHTGVDTPQPPAVGLEDRTDPRGIVLDATIRVVDRHGDRTLIDGSMRALLADEIGAPSIRCRREINALVQVLTESLGTHGDLVVGDQQHSSVGADDADRRWARSVVEAVGGGRVPSPREPTSKTARFRSDPKPQTKRGRRAAVGAGSAVAILAIVGAVFVLTQRHEGTGLRLADRRVTEVIAVGDGPQAIAANGAAVWVPELHDGTASRIDPDSSEVIDTIQSGPGPAGVAVNGEDVWITNRNEDTVVRIGGESDTVTDTIRVGDFPQGISAHSNSVWVANFLEGSVSRIDADVMRVVTTIAVGHYPQGISATGDAVWVTNLGSPDGDVGHAAA